MRISALLSILTIICVCAPAIAQVGTVSSYQKISDTQGDFTGTLDDEDGFGSSATSIGDLNSDGIQDLAIGATHDSDGGLGRGAVWVLFMNANGTVNHHQKISDTEGNFTGVLDDNDLFGISVASTGDLDSNGIPDLVVGSRFDDDGGFDKGAVWVLFMNANGTVNHHQKISDTEGNFTGMIDDGDSFGLSVTSPGDLNGDGIADLVVGAPEDDDGGTVVDSDRGAVWVLFMNGDGTVNHHQKISDTEGGFTGVLPDHEVFGWAVTSPGDLDRDGIPDLAIGSFLDDDGGTNRGAVWILFMNADGTVDHFQKISDTQGNFTGILDDDDFFGGSLASPGDLNQDGIADLVVGTVNDDDGGLDRGAVWVLFLNADGTVGHHQKISDTEGNFSGALDDADGFGIDVASADLNGDGVPDLAVEAAEDDDGGTDRGAVWVLFLNSPTHTAVDVHPSGCPNAINDNPHGFVTVAVLGSLDLDVNDIEVGTIRLEGVVTPVRFSIDDVADAFVGDVNNCSDCTSAAPTEGFSDLVLKFRRSDLLDALGSITDRECRELHLTGELNDGSPIAGTDFIILRAH